MVATFLASSSLTLLHLDGWLLCWALWLPPWRAVFAVNAAKPNLTPRRWKPQLPDNQHEAWLQSSGGFCQRNATDNYSKYCSKQRRLHVRGP